MYAILGGTGIYDLGLDIENITVDTPYGEVGLSASKLDGENLFFLSRHGVNHERPPHKVNYRANMYALKQLGVKYIYAITAVGSMNEKYSPSDVVILTDFIDNTRGRIYTYYDGDKGVKHVDMSDPYCMYLRGILESDYDFKGEAVYLSTEGPRFETAAEIRMYRNFADVVGMTNVPEVILAKELGMCYAAVGIITNWCTGVGSDIVMHEIEKSMKDNKSRVTELFLDSFRKIDETKKSCRCSDSLMEL